MNHITSVEFFDLKQAWVEFFCRSKIPIAISMFPSLKNSSAMSLAFSAASLTISLSMIGGEEEMVCGFRVFFVMIVKINRLKVDWR